MKLLKWKQASRLQKRNRIINIAVASVILYFIAFLFVNYYVNPAGDVIIKVIKGSMFTLNQLSRMEAVYFTIVQIIGLVGPLLGFLFLTFTLYEMTEKILYRFGFDPGYVTI